MRNMRSSITVGIAGLLVIGATSVRNIGNVRAADAESSAEEQPAVYVSTNPNVCANFSGLEYRVFVDAPLDNNLCGISFDLDFSGSAPIPVVLPENGVTLGTIDVSQVPYHLEAIWTSRPLEHEPIIRLLYAIEPSIGEFSTYNVTFETTSGESVPGYGMESITCCVDCFDCSVVIFASNRVLVPIGKTTIVPFEWAWSCWSAGGGPLTASDTEGWVVSWEPESAGDDATCGLCVVPIHDGWVEVFVPEGVPDGTTSSLTIDGFESSTEVILETEDVVSVDNSTWGKIKSLYR